jgi:hypothetical protein
VIKYPAQAQELVQLLKEDQEERRATGKAYFQAVDNTNLKLHRATLAKNAQQRVQRVLQILNEVGEPSLSNIGEEAAQAVSVLAVHGSLDSLRRILAAFIDLYEQYPDDTYYQAIPSMTDWVLVLERKPQRFGTQWLFDYNRQPYLPPVEDFEHVNKRRAKYDIEPLRWPRSLAIPESEQPWLKRPLSELVMREPTDEEYAELARALA